jgi:hypothetical protein
MCIFTEKGLPSSHSTIKAWLVECCREGCPSGSFSHLQRGTLELCQSDHWLLGHLPDQGPCPLIAQFGQAANSSKSLGGSKLLPFKNDGGHCVLGTFNAAEFFGTLPQICASTQYCLRCLRQFLRLHGLAFALTISQGWSFETGYTWAQFRVS